MILATRLRFRWLCERLDLRKDRTMAASTSCPDHFMLGHTLCGALASAQTGRRDSTRAWKAGFSGIHFLKRRELRSVTPQPSAYDTAANVTGLLCARDFNLRQQAGK